MRRPPLRLALLAPVLLTLLVGITGLGVYVERNVRGDLIDNLDAELERVLARDPQRGAPPNRGDGAPGRVAEGRVAISDTAVAPIELVVFADGTVESINGRENPFTEAQLAELFGTRATSTIEGDPSYRVRTVQGIGESTDLVAVSLVTVDESTASLRRNLLLGGVGLFVAQSIVVWVIAARVSRPVARMSEVARDIAAGELGTEVGPPEGTAETADLARDLEQMLLRLRSTIEDRERAAAEAETARADMQRFLADASHELRTPLTALRGYSDLFAGGMLEDDDALGRAMARIGSESERMQQLVTDMLHVVRTSSAVEQVSLSAVVGDVASDLRAAHPGRPIEVEIAADLHVLGDRNRLHQAVLNLGANACVHTKGESPIEIKVHVVDTRAAVDVVDHGPGIDPADAESIFRPFSRGDASRSRKDHDGAGLGLAIVRRIVDEHGGRVTLQPTPDGGATFRIELSPSSRTSTTNL